jgi:hypothetical protein
MTTIPTIATRKMFKSLTFWDSEEDWGHKRKVEAWKDELMVKIGISLWKLGYSSTEYDDFMGSGYSEFQVETSLPEEDIFAFDQGYINDINMDVTIPIVVQGSRSFWIGLAYVLDELERYNQDIDLVKEEFSEVNNYLTRVGGCGLPEDWEGYPEYHHCLVVRKWCEWIPNVKLLPDITVSDERKEMINRWDDTPSNWWELVERVENDYKEQKKLITNTQRARFCERECANQKMEKMKATIKKLQDRIIKNDNELSEIAELVNSMNDSFTIDTWDDLIKKTTPHYEDQF